MLNVDESEIKDILDLMDGAPSWEVAEAVSDLIKSKVPRMMAAKTDYFGSWVGTLAQNKEGVVVAISRDGRVTRLQQNVMGPEPERAPTGLHITHRTRSSDASSFDIVCIDCGATDEAGGGWGRLSWPCPVNQPVNKEESNDGTQ